MRTPILRLLSMMAGAAAFGTFADGTLLRDRDLHYATVSMRRRIVAAVWVAGATVPLLAATVFLVGCCVLPFHGVIHKLMPLCEMATSFMRSDHADDHPNDAVPPAPARETQEPVKRLVSLPGTSAAAIGAAVDARPLAVSAASAPRSFMTLGAVRCDQDVGLHVLDSTFLI